ncbi:MAG: 3-dehydroquinate synthase [Prevotella sp.]|nr:3-dehydroquinate synthase [Prevotella sp.]
MEQRVIISQNFQNELAMALSECERDHIFVLTDETTLKKCWPLLHNFFGLKHAQLITIPSGDQNKGLEAVSHVWSELGKGGATRHSCLINLGGGMVTDLGGFAASTFKRGINFINIPTTLLAMVDASVGGKTGINFGGLKNEIGVFNDSKFVILNAEFLKTLDSENIISGYAEMLKHGLISNEKMWAELVTFDISQVNRQENDIPIEQSQQLLKRLQRMVADSVKVKERIVNEDPHEQGIRKALNLGHTFGHAFESWALKRKPILHGHAVAFGLVCELYLSSIKCSFPTEQMRQTVSYIRENYGALTITCNDYEELLQLMTHDKKNRGNEINFTLLSGIGDIRINQNATEDEIKEALDFLREG